MPSFERSLSAGKSQLSGSYSYDKLFATINNYNNSSSTFSRNNRFSVSLKDHYNYVDKLKSMSDTEYAGSAGCSLSALFLPFQTRIAPSGTFPGFARGIPDRSTDKVDFHRLLPFQYESGVTNVLSNRWVAPSGDSLPHIISADKYYGDVNQFRHLDNIRGFGFRLPMIGVGWGFTNRGTPWPSGQAPAGQTEGIHYPSGSKFFKGGHLEGWQVDPSDYTAAPVDLRYDERRHVWTTGQKGMWAQLQTNPQWVSRGVGASGLAFNWTELEAGISGLMTPRVNGYIGLVTPSPVPSVQARNLGPAFEVNSVNIVPPSGQNVWIEFAEDRGYWIFNWHLPRSVERFKVLQVLDNAGSIGYDYPRIHGSI